MTSRFKLGDRVTISGQIVKTHSDGYTRWIPMDTDGYRCEWRRCPV